MADPISKELGLNNPADQHGSVANDHAQEKVHPKSDRSDADTVHDLEHDYEKGREAVRTASRHSQGLVRTQSGVDVEQAERDFAELSKQFSAHSRRMSKTHSHAKGSVARDVEKAISSEATSEEAWDLEESLRGAREADYEAGIKSKYIGTR